MLRVAALALFLLSPTAANSEQPTSPPVDYPDIWRIYPADESFDVLAGEYIVFQAGASDGDCDLRYFDWGNGTWQDPVSGCEAESSYGVHVPSVPAVYRLDVVIVDWEGHTSGTYWQVQVYSPVDQSSWGKIKALFR
jgi:hypothetical protein